MGQLGTTALRFAISTHTTSAVDYTASVSRVVILSTPGDELALTDLVPESKYELAMILAQDHAAGTLWDLAWAHAGEFVTFYVAPYGNTTATATQPHYTGTALVSEPDGEFIGGSADPSRAAVMTAEMTWRIGRRPTQLTSGTYPA